MAKGIWGVIAEFENPARLYEAAGYAQQEGYLKYEAWSPFPIHGIEKPMKLPGSKVPWVTLAGGLTGLSIATAMQWWMGGIDYPIVIGGKPLFTWEPSVPIMFELSILLSAFGTVIGMLVLNGLPKPSHPLDKYEPFRRVTDDKFFITIEASDPRFDIDTAKAFLVEHGGTNVAEVEE